MNEVLLDGSTNYIRVRYAAAGSPLAGGDVDQITFKMVDHITAETNLIVTAAATNVKHVWRTVDVAAGQTNLISIQIPPASAKIAIQPNVIFTSPTATVTNTLVYTLTNTGTGSNDLTNAVISFPAFLQNKILSVTNQLNTAITVDNIGKKITIWYTNTVLSASSEDSIFIYFENDFTSYQINEPFSCSVDNGTGAVSATAISGASFNVSVVKRPEIELAQADATPNQIYTTDTESTFTYKIQNGEAGGVAITKVRILIPAPFVTNFVPNSPWPGSTETFVSTNGKTYLEIDYTANDLDAGAQDELIITVDDTWTAGTTNVDWAAWVDYGDGYGWRSAEEKSGKSINISFIFPDAGAQAQISPRSINKNDSSSQMTLSITNTGVLGNHIYLVEVKLPVFITNITSITSSIIANNAVLTNSNTIVLEYYKYSTNIPAPGIDTITFTIHDNVTDITNDVVEVKVSNSSNSNDCKTATELFSDALKISYFKPDAVSYAYINPKYPISPAKPNSIYSTITTSTLEFHIVNNGASGNNLDIVRIYIPESEYYTNSVADISSAVVPGSEIYVNSNIITIFYTNTNYTLFPTQTDTITFSINDKITTNNSFAVWNSDSHFVTSGVQYLTNQISSGQTNVVFFEMPAPVVKAEFSPRLLYTTTTNVTLNFNVTNTGSGSNNINKLYLTIPADFRSGLNASSISNSFSASVSYNAGTFTMTYTNFSIGSNDSFTLILSNGYTTVNALDFSILADNGIATNSVVPLSSGYLTMNIVTPPSSYVEVFSPKDSVYNRLYSTDYENNYEIIIKNDGTGDADILKAIITLPAGFTVSSSLSTKIGGAFISNTNNIIVLDYQAGSSPIAVSQSDTVTITAADPFHYGDTNVTFNVKVDDGNGYSDTRLAAGKIWQVSFVHPAVQSEHYIDGYAVDTKPSVFVAPSAGTANTNFSVKIINTGSLSNIIHKSRIIVAEVFSIQNTPTSSFGGTVSVSSNVIEIDYSSAKLPAGGTDTIDFDVSYTLSAATNNMLIAAEVDNNNGVGYTASTLSTGKFNLVDIIYPPLSVLAGVKNLTSVYIINTNDTIQYQIKNRSQGYEIFRSVITNFDMTYFSSINVTSQKLATVTVSTGSNTITLEYSGANRIQFNESDIVTINVQYSITNLINTNLKMNNVTYLTNTVLTTQTNVTGLPLESIDTDLANSDNQNLGLRPAPYGRINGIVLPTFKIDSSDPDKTLPNIIKVEVVDSANNLVTTPYQKETDGSGGLVNKSLVTYSDSAGGGTYSINYVPENTPANTYALRFTAEGFKVTLTNFTIVSNQILGFSTQTLNNSLLNASSVNKQVVMDYNDTNTRFTVPTGGVLDQFSLDIGVVDMNTWQEDNVLINNYVKKINDSSMLGCFKFTLKDQNGTEVVGEGLSKDAVIQLHYTTSGLNLPIGTGWEEDNLAIFYWKDTTRKWIPIGGTVDKNKQIVSAKISYLHNYYSVMSVNPEASAKAIYNVIASPNPFTPGRGGDNSSKVKITFSLKDSQEKYTVSIFTLRGKRVKFFERDGTYRQGEVFWDGKDDNGFNIGGGVYLYQIKAGDKVFTGSILLLK
ncbi:MAG: hypothetical protein KAS64_03845 [Spirochaetes bacterium]|nr:hypothetical protein [Spirochaetota bacterium]